jgi:hypothetical protein
MHKQLHKEKAMKITWIAVLAGGVLMHSLAFADVSYQETTQVTGGSLMGMLKMAGAFSSQAKQLAAPVTSTVMIHGGRMLHSNPHSTEIIDLDQQTITFVDHDKRTYSLVTFQEIKDQMAKAAPKSKGAQPASSDGSQMSFTAHISSNGATREINGQTAKEALLSVTMVASSSDNSNTKAGMAATSEMWLVQDEPGLAEMRRFSERMAKEMSFDAQASAINSLLAAQPGGAQALAEIKKESAKMSGLPVLQVTRVGMTADGQPLPPPSSAPLSQSQTQGSAGVTAGGVTQEVAAGTATQTTDSQISRLGTFGRALSGSGMGGLMHHGPSTKSAPNQDPSGTGADAATAGVLLENQTQTSGFSEAAVDASGFQIPAGYKAVASPMEHK